MALHDIRKRPAISDQQKRREISLQRQQQNRRDAQQQARSLASTFLSLSSTFNEPSTSEHLLEIELNELESETECLPELLPEDEFNKPALKELDVLQASKLKGSEVRKWFSKQLLFPEWMIDIPDRLSEDWYEFARPSGKRCFVVSSNGTTISRLRNGSILHRLPSALPNGAKTKNASGSGQTYSILDCMFHELSFGSSGSIPSLLKLVLVNHLQTITNTNSAWYLYKHAIKWSLCGLYRSSIFCQGWHSHYQLGKTPLALVWKDDNYSRYDIDTDSNGQVPSQQQLVLELQGDGKVATSDDPSVEFGCLDGDLIEKLGFSPGNLLQFTIGDGGLTLVDGRIQGSNLHYTGKVNRARAFADTYSKVMFQYAARRLPIRIDDLLSSINSSNDGEDNVTEMVLGVQLDIVLHETQAAFC